MLFANFDGCMSVFVLICLAVGGFKLWLMVFRPEVYLEQQRQKHELKMVNRQRNWRALGIATTLLGIFFGRR